MRSRLRSWNRLKIAKAGSSSPVRDGVVELVAVLLEFLDVARQEVAAVAVERLDVAVEHQRGHRVVDRGLPVVGALEHAADEPGHLGLHGRSARARGRRSRPMERAPCPSSSVQAATTAAANGRGAGTASGARWRLFPITCLIHFALTSTRCLIN